MSKCPTCELKVRWAEEDRLSEELYRLEPTARCTYLLTEGVFIVFLGYRRFGSRWKDKIYALSETVRVLRIRDKLNNEYLNGGLYD